jgi:hypothetical protein
VARSVARRGEPYRTGFDPEEVQTLLAERGFACREHLRTLTLAQRYAPTRTSRQASDGPLAITTAHKA